MAVNCLTYPPCLRLSSRLAETRKCQEHNSSQSQMTPERVDERMSGDLHRTDHDW